MAPAWPASAARDARWPASSNCGMRHSCSCAGVPAHMRTESLRSTGRWRGRHRCPVQLPPTPCPYRGRTIGKTTPGAASHPDSTCGPRARQVHGQVHPRSGPHKVQVPTPFDSCGTSMQLLRHCTPCAGASTLVRELLITPVSGGRARPRQEIDGNSGSLSRDAAGRIIRNATHKKTARQGRQRRGPADARSASQRRR